MTDETLGLLVVVGVMALNQVVMRLAGLKGNKWVFYGLQIVNLVAGAAIILFGVPGLEQWPVVSWMIGLLFFYRTVQNNNDRVEWLRERRKDERREESRRADAIRDALRRGEDGR